MGVIGFVMAPPATSRVAIERTLHPRANHFFRVKALKK